jgi:hypothetical protein
MNIIKKFHLFVLFGALVSMFPLLGVTKGEIQFFSVPVRIITVIMSPSGTFKSEIEERNIEVGLTANARGDLQKNYLDVIIGEIKLHYPALANESFDPFHFKLEPTPDGTGYVFVFTKFKVKGW